MADVPLVTIVTPSLNQKRFIPATIDSVITQDYSRIEYMVVDGGSTDGTRAVLAAAGPAISWISEPDGGQADAISRAFARSNGEYLAWLNSDDLYLPGAVRTMSEFLSGHSDHGLVYGHVDNIDAEGRLIGPAKQVERFDEFRLLNEVDFIAQPATMFRRSAFDDVGGLDSTMHWAFDYDLWIRLSRVCQVGFVNIVLAQARIHPSAKTSTGGLARLMELERMARKHGRTSAPSGFAARMAWCRMTAAADAMRRRAVGQALRHGGAALKHAGAYAAYRARRLPRGHFSPADRTG